MTVRGWCPSLFAPMEAGDGWLVRVKPSGAALSAASAVALSDAAEQLGNGAIELTSRANLQFRGFSPESAQQFADRVVALGLADPATESRRNVLASPLHGIDPVVAPPTGAVAAAMEALLGDPAFAALPAKFGIVVDGGGRFGVAGEAGDIVLQLRGTDMRMSLDGSPLAAATSAPDIVVRRMIEVFLRSGARRMRDLVAADMFAAAGLKPDLRRWDGPGANPVGPHPGLAFGCGLRFGQTDAAGLRRMAALAGPQGLRLTPWRCILLPGVTDAEAHDFICDPTDPALAVQACAGMPACPHASVATRIDAAVLVQAGLAGSALHVSGCSKGCAHRLPCAVTLVGENGRYDIVRNGTAGAAPWRTRLALPDVMATLATLSEKIPA